MLGNQNWSWVVRTAFCMVFLAVTLGANCIPIVEPDPTPPAGDRPAELVASATADPETVFATGTTTLTGTATGGTEPYAFRWDLNGGPELSLGEITTSSFTTDALDEAGAYVFRVVVTDVEGMTDEAFITVDVGTVSDAEVPSLVVVDDPAAISINLDDEFEDAVLEWSIVSGTATIDDPTARDTTITAEKAETIELRLTITIPTESGTPQSITRDFEIASAFSLSPQILVETSLGDFTIELRGLEAPTHTANMLLYSDDGFFDGLLVHRVACSRDASSGICEPFVIQGGGFHRVDEEIILKDPTRDPIESEASSALSNEEVYSVALALTSGNADSGTTQFFVNMQDNSFLDAQGFTAFGVVVSGTDVVDTIAAVEVTDSSIIPGEVSLPVVDVILTRVSRVAP